MNKKTITTAPIKSFLTFLNESEYSKELEWDNQYRYFKNLKEIYSSPEYSIYQVGEYEFFLVDEDNDYLGQITFNDEWKPVDGIQIYTTDSNGRIKGFYKIMFTQILKNTKHKLIYSDGKLSDDAIRSYTRLNTDPAFNIKIKNMETNEIIDFDPKLLGHNARDKHYLVLTKLR